MRQIIESTDGTMVFSKHAVITVDDINKVSAFMRENKVYGVFTVKQVSSHVSTQDDVTVGTFTVGK